MTASGMTTSADVAAYAAAVREALTDLEPNEARSLLDGLDDHLAEVAAADPDLALVDALGPASAYAAELRRSAGAPTGMVRHSAAAVAPAMPPPPPPPPQVATTAPRAMPDPTALRADGRSLLWRIALGALVAAAVVLVALSLTPPHRITIGRALLGALIAGGGWLAASMTLNRSSLGERVRRRVSVLLGVVVVIGAVALGGRLAHGRTVYQTYYATDPGACCVSVTTITSPIISSIITAATIPPLTTLPAEALTSTTMVIPSSLPNLVGLTIERAVAELSSLGIGYSIVYTESSSLPAGAVIDQSPESDTYVGPLSNVTLFVAGATGSTEPTAGTATTAPVLTTIVPSTSTTPTTSVTTPATAATMPTTTPTTTR